MLHTFPIFTTELETLKSYIIVKAEANYNVEDTVMLQEKSDDESNPETYNKFTGKQIFFTITRSLTSGSHKGIKNGFALIEIKRTKNPFTAVNKVNDLVEEKESD